MNIHAIYNKLVEGKMVEGEHLTYSEFKRQLAKQLCVADNPLRVTNMPTTQPDPVLITKEVTRLHSHQMYQIHALQYMPFSYVYKMKLKKK